MGKSEQGADLWSEIPATRFADGQLWTSNLSLDQVGRHQSLFGMMANPIVSNNSTGTTGNTDQTFTIFFPDSWSVDVTYANVKLVVQLEIQLSQTGGGFVDGSIFFIGGSNSRGLSGNLGEVFITKDYLPAALPTGETSLTIRMNVDAIPGGTTIAFDRSGIGGGFDAGGASCGWALLPLEANT